MEQNLYISFFTFRVILFVLVLFLKFVSTFFYGTESIYFFSSFSYRFICISPFFLFVFIFLY